MTEICNFVSLSFIDYMTADGNNKINSDVHGAFCLDSAKCCKTAKLDNGPKPTAKQPKII